MTRRAVPGFALALAAAAIALSPRPARADRFCLPPQSQSAVQDAWARATSRVPDGAGFELDTIRFSAHDVRLTVTHEADRWTLVGTRPEARDAARHFDFAVPDAPPPPAVVLDLARAFDAEWRSDWVPCQGSAAGESGERAPGPSLPFWLVVATYGACVACVAGLAVTAARRLREPPAP